MIGELFMYLNFYDFSKIYSEEFFLQNYNDDAVIVSLEKIKIQSCRSQMKKFNLQS
jgi:hypothetical protein